jgi:hypothetical protein
MAITRITTGENSFPQARFGQIRLILYAKGRPLWRGGAGGRASGRGYTAVEHDVIPLDWADAVQEGEIDSICDQVGTH